MTTIQTDLGSADDQLERASIKNRFFQYWMQERGTISSNEQAGLDEELLKSKLAVEREALVARWMERNHEEAALKSARGRFVDHFVRRLTKVVGSPEQLSVNVPITAPQLELMVLLLNDTVDRTRIRALVEGMPGLGDTLLRFVNSPKWSHKRKNVLLGNSKLALNFLGVDQLRLILPWLIFQQWGRDRHSLFGGRLRKLWRFAKLHGNAAEYLAEQQGLCPYQARILALMQSLDWLLVLQHGTKEFNQLKEEWLIKARKSGAKVAHEAVNEMKFPSSSLLPLLQQGQPSTLLLMRHLKMADTKLYARVRELYLPDVDAMSDMADIVCRAQIWAMSQLLVQRRSVSYDELKALLKAHRIPDMIIPVAH